MVHHALRRQVALAGLCAAAREVAHADAAAVQQGIDHQLEELARHRPPRRIDDAHTLEQRLGVRLIGPQHLVDAFEQWLQVPADDAFGVQLAQQLVGHQQAVQLSLVEPQAG